MKKVLITGFDPFGNDKMNPSYEAVKLLPDTINDITVIKVEIPTVQDKSVERVIELIKEHNPDIVINVGQAGGRICITPERVAINLLDYGLKDNDGNNPMDIPYDIDGPAAYFSTLPVKNIVRSLNKIFVPSSLSNTAGTFVCNSTMYGVAHYIVKNNLNIKSGFIHVPYAHSQVSGKQVSSMSLDTIIKGLTELIKASFEDEAKVTMGTTH